MCRNVDFYVDRVWCDTAVLIIKLSIDMWNCKACGAEVENDAWDNCWNCSTNKHGFDPDAVAPPEKPEAVMKCLRCGEAMEFSGTSQFHEGTRFGVLGNLAELLVDKQAFDLFVCGGCGKVEFYLEGMGNPRNPPRQGI